MLKCCITGPRPQSYLSNNIIKRAILKNKLKKAIIKSIRDGYRYFITGMALGIDTMFAEIILNLKQSNADLFLECALPCIDQYSKWNKNEIKNYNLILSLADKVTYVSNKQYFRGCMHKRNKYMVDSATRVICVYSESKGTLFTLMYAQKKEKEILLLKQ